MKKKGIAITRPRRFGKTLNMNMLRRCRELLSRLSDCAVCENGELRSEVEPRDGRRALRHFLIQIM
jgi:hypothetical protein